MAARLFKVFGGIFVIASILFISWMFVSWVDIIVDNTSLNPQHFDWNLLVLLFS